MATSRCSAGSPRPLLLIWRTAAISVILAMAFIVGSIMLVFSAAGLDDRMCRVPDAAGLVLHEQIESLQGALEAYRTMHGKFPETLRDLIPDHLDCIPTPPFGHRAWSYHRSTHSYELWINCGILGLSRLSVVNGTFRVESS